VFIGEEADRARADPVGVVDVLEDGAEQFEIGFVDDDDAAGADALGDGPGVVAEGEAEDDDAAVGLDVDGVGDGSGFGEGATLAGEGDGAGWAGQGGAGDGVGGVEKGEIAPGRGLLETLGDARVAEGEGFEVSRKYCARLVICWAGFIIEQAESRGVQGIGIE